LQNFLVASLGLAIADRRAPPSSSQARSLAGQDFMKGKAMAWRAGARGGRTGGGPFSKRNHGEGADPQPSKRRDRSENAFSFMRTAIGGFDCNFDLPTDSSRSRRDTSVLVGLCTCAWSRGGVGARGGVPGELTTTVPRRRLLPSPCSAGRVGMNGVLVILCGS
jgi:hypothetical protein